MESSRQYDLNAYAKDIIRHKARQLIGNCGFTRDDYEDLKQEMALDLLVRLSKFDQRKADLNTFIARVVERKISTIIRHRMQEKRDYRCRVCSLDDPIEDKGGATFTREQTISQDEIDQRRGKFNRPEGDRIDMRLDVSLVLSDLPPDLRRLAQLLMTESITEAARDLGVPRSTLYETGIARLRRAFEDKGLNKYL